MSNVRKLVVNSMWGVVLLLWLSGCHLWPTMSNEDGRRPLDMGKSDQVLAPNAPPPLHLSESFGKAFRTARENQILYPDASKNLDPVTGLDGQAAEAAVERYRKQFKEPAYEMEMSSGGGGK